MINKKSLLKFSTAFITGMMVFSGGNAMATPSTQVWIPSTDIQKFGTVHLNFDNYFRYLNEPADDKGNTIRKSPIFVIGPTVGILPFDKIQAEIGFDLMFQGDKILDNSPLYFHGKIGTPEDSMFTWSPAVALGIYNVGINAGTMQNITYGLIAKTFPVIGRLSAGYYYGNPSVLVDENAKPANQGLLASWDKTMNEIPAIGDKLWLAVDYQGGNSALGTLNFGLAYAFAPNASVIFGYDLNLNKKVAGSDTFTVQVDVNL